MRRQRVMRKEVLALWERQDDRVPVDGGYPGGSGKIALDRWKQ
jgi:hypothetical protein